MVRGFRTGAVAILMLGAMVENLPAQEDFGARLGVRRGGEVFYEPTGPGVLFDALGSSSEEVVRATGTLQ